MKSLLGKTVHWHRKRAGLTRVQLAELAGVGKTFIFDLEQGRESVRLDRLLKVLHVLNIHIKFEGPLQHEVERG